MVLVDTFSSNDIITIKIDKRKLKNVKKSQEDKQTKRLFKQNLKWAVKWTKGKGTQIMRWNKDNLQIFTFKEFFKKIISS